MDVVTLGPRAQATLVLVKLGTARVQTSVGQFFNFVNNLWIQF